MADMTDRTLRISARMAEEIQQWASDELSQWPRDTAYAADLENLLSQLTAAVPAPDAVARLRTENDRLRAALTVIAEWAETADGREAIMGRARTASIARAALAQDGGE